MATEQGFDWSLNFLSPRPRGLYAASHTEQKFSVIPNESIRNLDLTSVQAGHKYLTTLLGDGDVPTSLASGALSNKHRPRLVSTRYRMPCIFTSWFCWGCNPAFPPGPQCLAPESTLRNGWDKTRELRPRLNKTTEGLESLVCGYFFV